MAAVALGSSFSGLAGHPLSNISCLGPFKQVAQGGPQGGGELGATVWCDVCRDAKYAHPPLKQSILAVYGCGGGNRDGLKVHKNEIFFGSDFEFFAISLLVMFKYYGFVKKKFDRTTIGGDTIIPLSLRLSRIEFS